MNKDGDLGKPMGKSVLVYCSTILIILVALFVLVCAGPPLYYGIKQRRNLNRSIETSLNEIASACVSLTERIPEGQTDMYQAKDDPSTPSVLSEMDYSSLYITRRIVNVEMHGGFDHFGIRVSRKDVSNSTWIVERYWEGGSLQLTTITMDAKVERRVDGRSRDALEDVGEGNTHK